MEPVSTIAFVIYATITSGAAYGVFKVSTHISNNITIFMNQYK